MTTRTQIGIAFLCLGVFVFSLQDAIIKLVSDDYSVTQAIYIRSLIAVPLLASLVHFEVGITAILSPRSWLLFLRGAVLFASYVAYYLAFPAIPLADAVALYFAAPLFIVALARPFLGEAVNWRSWVAIAAGSGGVLLMLQPGTSVFEPAALLSLFSALLYACAALMTRRLGADEPASVMAFYQNLVFLAGSAVLAIMLLGVGTEEGSHPSLVFLTQAWRIPARADLMLLVGCGIIAAVGGLLLTHAYRISQANVVGVFEYSGILWVPLWGFVFFTEIPRWTTILGAAVIVGAGILTLSSARGQARAGKHLVYAQQRDTRVPTQVMLGTLRNIADLRPNEEQLFRLDYINHLCDMGYVVDLGAGRYRVTGEGKAVLSKAAQ